MKKLFYALIVICIAVSGYAQVPNSFKYQAVAHNLAGQPIINTDLAARISIIQDSTNGNVVYSEVHHAHSNDFGLFSLDIGKGIPSGDFSAIDWSQGLHFLEVEVDENNGTNFTLLGTSQLLSVPYALFARNAANGTQWLRKGNDIYYDGGRVGIGLPNPVGSLSVQASPNAPGDTLFEVKDKIGQTIFGVYEDGVRIYVKDGLKGGRGGFAVGGRTRTKAYTQDIMWVTPDSVRIYINDSSLMKGGKGGFAVGGRRPAKGPLASSYFDVSARTSAEIINPSQPRILWYPAKEALLTGRVLIESPDSIGTNSFTSGFESKAIGEYSQAMGYHCIARGKYSTAFGDSSLAAGASSFAAGYNAHALVPGTFALGNNVVANGFGSFAIGINSSTQGLSAIAIGLKAISNGFVSVAIGNGARANKSGSTALGNSALSDGFNSIALGFNSKALGNFSSSLGNNSQTLGENATALGFNAVSQGNYSAALGSDAKTSGNGAIALGYNALANADYSTALGNNARADSVGGIALGNGSRAKHFNGIAVGTGANSSGTGSVAIGNNSNASADNATAIGSNGTIANGAFSMAFGFNASTDSQEGSIVFGDHSPSATTVKALGPNQFIARANGGIVFYTKSDLSTSASITSGSPSWNISSDRRKKENFTNVSRELILQKLQPVNIQSWNYIAQGKQIRHFGITAQDFWQAFGIGHSDTCFIEVDLAGVSMIAIQALADRTDNLNKQLQVLQADNQAMHKALNEKDTSIEMLRGEITKMKSLQAEIDQLKTAIATNSKEK